MTVNQTDLDNFHDFATQFLASAGRELSLDDLVSRWQAERERVETIDSIRRGVADAEAGRVHGLREMDATIRSQLGFPPRDG